MPTKRSFLLVLFTLALPSSALAASLQISELMYNPAGSDTGREWVELYNPTGSDITLVGGSGKNSWRIGDSSNHTLTDPSGGTGRGSLTVPAGGYLVIASDPTEFISGEYAGGSYSVVKSSISLSNTGATVSLIDGSGTTVDSVTYTKDQGASDDGSSLQRQADNTWIAGLPTPGAVNTTTLFVAQTTDASSSNTNSNTASTTSSSAATQAQNTVSSYVAPPQPLVFADGGDNRTVIVGADTTFRGRAYDRKDLPVDHVRFTWNFGDGTTAEGASVQHHYSYPGRYAAVLMIADQTDTESDHFVVTAVPAELAFRVEADGSVTIENKDTRDLDLSGWLVRSFARTFSLPPETVVLKGASLRIGHEALGFFADPNTELEYPNGAHALAANQISDAAPTPTVSTSLPVAPSTKTPEPPRASAPVAPSRDASVQEQITAQPDADSETASSTALAAAAASAWHFSWWWLAALGIAIVAAFGVAMARHMRKGEWDIVEESE